MATTINNKRDRWTILDIDEEVIKIIRRFARRNGYTTGRALGEIVYKLEKQLKGAKDEV